MSLGEVRYIEVKPNEKLIFTVDGIPQTVTEYDENRWVDEGVSKREIHLTFHALRDDFGKGTNSVSLFCGQSNQTIYVSNRESALTTVETIDAFFEKKGN